jgi:Fe-S-cluster containining protein
VESDERRAPGGAGSAEVLSKQGETDLPAADLHRAFGPGVEAAYCGEGAAVFKRTGGPLLCGRCDQQTVMEQELRQAVMQAADRAPVREAVEAVYAALQDAINIRRPVCVTSGRCCRFEEYGHRLYVTTMELAKFVSELSVVSSPLSVAEPTPKDIDSPGMTISLPLFATDNGQRTTDKPGNLGCPFQVDKLCGVHTIRPFGCRIFFCDETSTQWQHDLYERLHADLRRAHEVLDVPYHYIEWRFALRSLGIHSL